MLDRDKEYYDRYQDSLVQIDLKKKEIEDMRIKFNTEIDEKKLRIAFLNNEKHELNNKVRIYNLIKINQLESDLKDFLSQHENSKKDFIEFHTQIKIMKQSIQQKNENILMLTEETEIWKNELRKEKLSHFNTQQTVEALEIKLQKLKAEKLHHVNSTLY